VLAVQVYLGSVGDASKGQAQITGHRRAASSSAAGVERCAKEIGVKIGPYVVDVGYLRQRIIKVRIIDSSERLILQQRRENGSWNDGIVNARSRRCKVWLTNSFAS
jgi:hypothetical protein